MTTECWNNGWWIKVVCSIACCNQIPDCPTWNLLLDSVLSSLLSDQWSNNVIWSRIKYNSNSNYQISSSQWGYAARRQELTKPTGHRSNAHMVLRAVSSCSSRWAMCSWSIFLSRASLDWRRMASKSRLMAQIECTWSRPAKETWWKDWKGEGKETSRQRCPGAKKGKSYKKTLFIAIGLRAEKGGEESLKTTGQVYYPVVTVISLPPWTSGRLSRGDACLAWHLYFF